MTKEFVTRVLLAAACLFRFCKFLSLFRGLVISDGDRKRVYMSLLSLCYDLWLSLVIFPWALRLVIFWLGTSIPSLIMILPWWEGMTILALAAGFSFRYIWVFPSELSQLWWSMSSLAVCYSLTLDWMVGEVALLRQDP